MLSVTHTGTSTHIAWSGYPTDVEIPMLHCLCLVSIIDSTFTTYRPSSNIHGRATPDKLFQFQPTGVIYNIINVALTHGLLYMI